MAEEQAQATAAEGATAFGSSEFEALLQKEFRPKSDQAKTAVESAVKTLAEQALARRSLARTPLKTALPAHAHDKQRLTG